MFYFSCVYFFFQICSNINTCVCDLGFGGHDCSKLVPTFPPPFTNKPTGPTTQAPDAGLTPSNTYIRKYSVFLQPRGQPLYILYLEAQGMRGMNKVILKVKSACIAESPMN